MMQCLFLQKFSTFLCRLGLTCFVNFRDWFYVLWQPAELTSHLVDSPMNNWRLLSVPTHPGTLQEGNKCEGQNASIKVKNVWLPERTSTVKLLRPFTARAGKKCVTLNALEEMALKVIVKYVWPNMIGKHFQSWKKLDESQHLCVPDICAQRQSSSFTIIYTKLIGLCNPVLLKDWLVRRVVSACILTRNS